MLSPDRLQNPMPFAAAAADYDVVRRAIGHIRGHWREQPEIETIAEAAGVTPTELHHLFRRWAGLTPKAFLQALTLDGARQLLRDSASVLDATYEVGLSGPGRLHDLFVTHEAMSPGEWKSGGEGLTMRSSRTHNGLSVTSRTPPRLLTLRTIKAEAVILTSS